MSKLNYLIGMLNWVDWIIIVVFCRFLYKSFQKGLLTAFFHFFRMGLVLFFSLSYFLVVAQGIQKYTLIPLPYAKSLSFFIIGCFVFFIVWGFGKVFGRLVTMQFASWLDRMGGLLFGVMHYFLVVGFFIFFIFPSGLLHQQLYEKSFISKKIVPFLYENYSILAKIKPKYSQKPSLKEFTQINDSSEL